MRLANALTKHEDAIGSLPHATTTPAAGISCFAHGPSSHVNEGTKGLSEGTRLVDTVASPASVLASLFGEVARVVSAFAKLVGPLGTFVTAIATLETYPRKLVSQLGSLVSGLCRLANALAKREPALSPLAHAMATRRSTTPGGVHD